MKFFKTTKQKNWEAQHGRNWSGQFDFNNEGKTNFQESLTDRITEVISSTQIDLRSQVSEVRYDEVDRNGVMIELNGSGSVEFKIWIYWNMSDFKLNQSHFVFEHWDYLSPEEYFQEYLGVLRKKIKTATNNG